MVAGNHDSTSTSLLALLDLVQFLETLSLVGSLELLSKSIVTNASSVNDRPRRKNILRSGLIRVG